MLLGLRTVRGRVIWGAGAAVLVSIAVLAGGQFVGGFDPTNPRVTLADIERTVSKRFPVPEVSVAELAPEVGGSNAILFDVRTREEFDQSHIAGAIWVDPDMSAEAFARAHGEQVRGKKAVFYCAVGVRSGIMAQRVAQSLASFGPTGVLNLTGGAFRWRAQQRPFMSSAGPVRTVHPYDGAWGKLLDRTLASEGLGSR